MTEIGVHGEPGPAGYRGSKMPTPKGVVLGHTHNARIGYGFWRTLWRRLRGKPTKIVMRGTVLAKPFEYAQRTEWK